MAFEYYLSGLEGGGLKIIGCYFLYGSTIAHDAKTFDYERER